MIIHIGWDVCVPSRNLIAILDSRSALHSPETLAFIRRAREEDRFTPCPEGERAYLIVQEEDCVRVVASAISPATLQKRFMSNGLNELLSDPQPMEMEDEQ